MTRYHSLPDTTPVLVGAGQVVQRVADGRSPMQLAASAANAALVDCGGSGVAELVDTVSVTRLFSDSMGFQPSSFGSSNNPPMSVAAAVGATPRDCIYGQVGGNEPQSRIIEFARDIAAGSRELVLLAGAEAAFNQRSAERAGETLDWRETFEQPMEDRGWGDFFVSKQELANGMLLPMQYYGMIEQAQAGGVDAASWRGRMARLCAGMSRVAAENPHAQYPEARSVEELLAGRQLSHLYSKGMIARDGVNLGAALVLCSIGCARRAGIPEDRWVFIHALAEGKDVDLSRRDDPGHSVALDEVMRAALEQAEVADPAGLLLDLYSCFPCAVSAAAGALGLPADDGQPLTLTGGLPFFGGPGNNYAMHGIAAAVARLRREPERLALVSAVGGMLSKHAVGVYGCRPGRHDWARADTSIDASAQVSRDIVDDPGSGRLVTYVVNFSRGEPAQVMAMGQADDGRRFVATSAPGDRETVTAFMAAPAVGRLLRVTAAGEGRLHFTLVD